MVTTGPARLRIQTKVFRDHNDEDGGGDGGDMGDDDDGDDDDEMRMSD